MQISSAHAETDIRLDGAVEVAAAAGQKAVLLRHGLCGLGRPAVIGGVKDFHPQKTPCFRLREELLQLLGHQTEEGMRQHRADLQLPKHLQNLQALGTVGRMIKRPIRVQNGTEGFLGRLAVARLRQGSGDVGPVHPTHHLLPQLLPGNPVSAPVQSLHQLPVVFFLLLLEDFQVPFQLHPCLWSQEQAHNMHLMPFILCRDLNPRNRPDCGSPGRLHKFRQSRQGVVIRQSHGSQTNLPGLLHQFFGGNCPVGCGGMGMQITKNHSGTSFPDLQTFYKL